MWGELILGVILLGAILWWMQRLSRNLIRALEKHNHHDDVLNSSYPVFSESDIYQSYIKAVAASRNLQRIECETLRNPRFEEATQRHSISEDISRQMLNVCEAIVDAERWWYLHSTKLDANIAVLTGKSTRDEALAGTKARFDLVAKDMFGFDASKLRDEWKLRIEDQTVPIRDPSPRSYSNPWFDRAKQQYPWNSYTGD